MRANRRRSRRVSRNAKKRASKRRPMWLRRGTSSTVTPRIRSQLHMFGQPEVVKNRHGSRRRRGSLRRNLIGYDSQGKTVQIVAYRPGSKRGGPVNLAGMHIKHGYIRRFSKLGGAAKEAHASRGSWRAKLAGYLAQPRRTSRKGSKRAGSQSAVTKNRRHSMRRRMSRNPKYVVMNKRGSKRRGSKRRGSKRGKVTANRRRRGLRRNFLKVYGKDLLRDIAMPATAATAGFLAANALSNAAASMDGVRNVLDTGRAPDAALATKSVVNGLGIVATLGLAAWGAKSGNKLIVDNATPVLTGMGLALFARLLRGTQLNPYLGEYVEQPMSGLGQTYYAAAGIGAYVNDPTHGMGRLGDATYYATAGSPYAEGIDPANQEGIDGLMDVMEAAAGTPVMEAAAGVGEYVEQPMSGMGEYVEQPMSGLGETYYAAAGMGQSTEADATLQNWYQNHQPPFVSTQTPTDMAREVTKQMPYERKIPTSLVTPEGKGYAGGLFSRQLFSGMF